MMATRLMAPVAVAVWLAIVTTGLALAAMAAMEPPVWDALSYAVKAFTFWQAVDAGKLFDPFALPMTVRPPGTILMSYPFGWSDDFRWFYFRSCIIPILLLIAAVYVAGWSRQLTRSGHWILAGLALVLAGMPALYQFQRNDFLPAAVAWGLVDGFLAGVCAVAAAAAVRGVATRSTAWSALAAAAAAFGFWIKPYGLALMALIGLAWLILLCCSLNWRFMELRRDAALRRFVVVSLAVATVCYALAVGLAFRSAYFSAENLAFGRRVFAILQTEATPLTLPFIDSLVRTCFGYAMPIIVLIGFLTAMRNRIGIGAAVAALVSLLVGLWLWLGQTEANQIRYFLPFGVVAFIFLLPSLMSWLQSLKPVIAYAVAGAAAAPTLVVTTLLLMPAPSDLWQFRMGVSLHVNDYQAENEQAADFLAELRAEGAKNVTAYFNGVTSVLRNLISVWEISRVTDATGPQILVHIPVDWQRSPTVRTEEILHSDVIAAEFVRDDATRAAILAERQVPDYPALTRLFNAWISSLTEEDGIKVVSETRVRLVRIVDRTRLESALARLEADHDMPQAYRDANPQRWWSAAELAAHTSAQTANTAFHAGAEGAAALTLRATELVQSVDGLHTTFWLEPAIPDLLGRGWYLFGHLIDQHGNIVANSQIDISPGQGPTPDRTIRYYRLFYGTRPAAAVALAFGVFKPGTPDEFLIPDQGTRDWDGRRVILPLPASQ